MVKNKEIEMDGIKYKADFDGKLSILDDYSVDKNFEKAIAKITSDGKIVEQYNAIDEKAYIEENSVELNENDVNIKQMINIDIIEELSGKIEKGQFHFAVKS